MIVAVMSGRLGVTTLLKMSWMNGATQYCEFFWEQAALKSIQMVTGPHVVAVQEEDVPQVKDEYVLHILREPIKTPATIIYMDLVVIEHYVAIEVVMRVVIASVSKAFIPVVHVKHIVHRLKCF